MQLLMILTIMPQVISNNSKRINCYIAIFQKTTKQNSGDFDFKIMPFRALYICFSLSKGTYFADIYVNQTVRQHSLLLTIGKRRQLFFHRKRPGEIGSPKKKTEFILDKTNFKAYVFIKESKLTISNKMI